MLKVTSSEYGNVLLITECVSSLNAVHILNITKASVQRLHECLLYVFVVFDCFEMACFVITSLSLYSLDVESKPLFRERPVSHLRDAIPPPRL